MSSSDASEHTFSVQILGSIPTDFLGRAFKDNAKLVTSIVRARGREVQADFPTALSLFKRRPGRAQRAALSSAAASKKQIPLHLSVTLNSEDVAFLLENADDIGIQILQIDKPFLDFARARDRLCQLADSYAFPERPDKDKIEFPWVRLSEGQKHFDYSALDVFMVYMLLHKGPQKFDNMRKVLLKNEGKIAMHGMDASRHLGGTGKMQVLLQRGLAINTGNGLYEIKNVALAKKLLAEAAKKTANRSIEDGSFNLTL